MISECRVIFIFVSLRPPNSGKDFRGGRENNHCVILPLCDEPCGLCACRWDRASRTMKPYDKSNVSRGLAVKNLSSDWRFNVRWFSRPFALRDRSDTSESRATLICQFLFWFPVLYEEGHETRVRIPTRNDVDEYADQRYANRWRSYVNNRKWRSTSNEKTVHVQQLIYKHQIPAYKFNWQPQEFK